ncbi:hypothetical protein B0H12DRAFT_1145725 [Mycena haematopus]|nr:hypothetical protein B0H12DRAFT_1145725 [Mycena haematopus]
MQWMSPDRRLGHSRQSTPLLRDRPRSLRSGDRSLFALPNSLRTSYVSTATTLSFLFLACCSSLSRIPLARLIVSFMIRPSCTSPPAPSFTNVRCRAKCARCSHFFRTSRSLRTMRGLRRHWVHAYDPSYVHLRLLRAFTNVRFHAKYA